MEREQEFGMFGEEIWWDDRNCFLVGLSLNGNDLEWKCRWKGRRGKMKIKVGKLCWLVSCFPFISFKTCDKERSVSGNLCLWRRIVSFEKETLRMINLCNVMIGLLWNGVSLTGWKETRRNSDLSLFWTKVCLTSCLLQRPSSFPWHLRTPNDTLIKRLSEEVVEIRTKI